MNSTYEYADVRLKQNHEKITYSKKSLVLQQCSKITKFEWFKTKGNYRNYGNYRNNRGINRRYNGCDNRPYNGGNSGRNYYGNNNYGPTYEEIRMREELEYLRSKDRLMRYPPQMYMNQRGGQFFGH